MRLALLLHAVNPALGGVLVRGQKGTAKSTAVRALAALLPEIERVAGCPYGCDPREIAAACESCSQRITASEAPAVERARVPVVELPIGATEDRVVGSLDLESAIQSGERRFEPGLLARANRGILYMDEVNLLGDHLVDLLLDAAAMGRNYVEREGVSISHPAQVMLIGTMNPEEGELRPQLLDRFALAVEVGGLNDADARAAAVRNRLAFERDPAGFIAAQAPVEAAERDRLERARARLPRVELPSAMLDLAVQLCAGFGVDGLRADLALCRAAIALAAYRGRGCVTLADVRAVAPLVLAHRRRRQPFEQPGIDEAQLDEALAEFENRQDGAGRGDSSGSEPSIPAPAATPSINGASASAPAGTEPRERRGEAAPVVTPAPERWTAPSELARPLTLPQVLARAQREARGRRPAPTGTRGEVVRSGRPRGRPRELALAATLRAAAPYQRSRRSAAAAGRGIVLRDGDLRERVRRGRSGNLVLFALDASGSMGARARMAAAKRQVLDLLLDVYRRRDRVAIVVFRGSGAVLALPPTNSVDLAQQRLIALPTGGRTPLAAGLRLAAETARRAASDDRGLRPLLVLVSDGRANAEAGGADPWRSAQSEAERWRAAGWPSVVLDPEPGRAGAGLARSVAGSLGATYLHGGTGAESSLRAARRP